MTTKEFAIAWVGAVVVAVLSSIGLGATERPPSHIHSGNHRIQEVIRFALARSESFQDLVATLDLSDRVVYVEEGPCSDSEHPSCIRLMPNSRDLLVHFDPRQPIRTAAAALAHELYHAVEICRAPEVVDTDSLRVLYRQIGDLSCPPPSRYDCWETRAAQTFQALVMRQLANGTRKTLPTEPTVEP